MKKRTLSDLEVGQRLVVQNKLYVVVKFEDGLAQVTCCDDGAQYCWTSGARVDALDIGEIWVPYPEASEGIKTENPGAGLTPLSVARADLRHVLYMQQHNAGGATQEAIDRFLNAICDMVEDYLDRR